MLTFLAVVVGLLLGYVLGRPKVVRIALKKWMKRSSKVDEKKQ